MYIYTCVLIHTYTCKYTCVLIHMHIYTYIHIPIHMHISSYTYMYIYMCPHTYIYMYVHICPHTYAYTYICTTHRGVLDENNYQPLDVGCFLMVPFKYEIHDWDQIFVCIPAVINIFFQNSFSRGNIHIYIYKCTHIFSARGDMNYFYEDVEGEIRAATHS